MDQYYSKVKGYLQAMDFEISIENEDDGVFVISKEDDGITNMVLICADPILIMEQFLFELKTDKMDVFKSLLEKNRDIIHGAFAIDNTGKGVIFRDTLQLENLDQNEFEGSVNSLALLLSEYANKIIEFSK